MLEDFDTAQEGFFEIEDIQNLPSLVEALDR